MDLFDLSRRDRTPPQDLARAPLDAQGGELLVRPIKFGQENTPFPNDGRRQSSPHRRLPKDVLVGAKVDGRPAFAESRGIRPSKLGPPRLAAVLRRGREAGQNDGCQKSDPSSSCHDGFLSRLPCENRSGQRPGECCSDTCETLCLRSKSLARWRRKTRQVVFRTRQRIKQELFGLHQPQTMVRSRLRFGYENFRRQFDQFSVPSGPPPVGFALHMGKPSEQVGVAVIVESKLPANDQDVASGTTFGQPNPDWCESTLGFFPSPF